MFFNTHRNTIKLVKPSKRSAIKSASVQSMTEFYEKIIEHYKDISKKYHELFDYFSRISDDIQKKVSLMEINKITLINLKSCYQ